MKLRRNKSKPKRTLGRKIINTVIGIFEVMIILLIAFFIFSQTKTFRDYLQDKIIETYGENLNGELQIKDIKGTLITSLELADVNLKLNNHELFRSSKIMLKLNPISIFQKELIIQKVLLDSLKFSLREDEPGRWNINDLAKKDSTNIAGVEDSVNVGDESEFPFKIRIKDLSILNSEFVVRDYQHLNSDSVHSVINFNDLDVSDFNFRSSIRLDLNKNQYELELKELSADLNSENFSIEKLAGNFIVTDKFAQISSFYLKTKLSELELSARLDSINLFGKLDLYAFKNYPVMLNLKATPFNFDDLSSFLESTDILKGAPEVELEGKGLFGDLDIDKLNIKLNETVLNAKGKLTKLNEPENLFIDVNLFNSTINESDAVRLLPEIGIPDYNGLTLTDAVIKFKGEPTNFYSSVSAKYGKGSLNVNGFMDVSKPDLIYDLNFETVDLNLYNILEENSRVTAKGKIKGKGTDPKKLEAQLTFDARNSYLGNYVIDTLSLESQAIGKKIDLDLYSYFNNTETEVRGLVDLTNDNHPAYNLTGNISGLNLEEFSTDTTFKSDLNFSFVASGFDLNPDVMTGNFFVEMRESKFGGVDINDSRLTLFLTKNEGFRSVKLKSDFIDLNIEGRYKLTEAIAMLSAQSASITGIIDNQIQSLNPASIVSSTNTFEPAINDSAINNNVAFDFDFKVKDFELISLLLRTKEFDIAGEGNGSVQNDSSAFSFNAEFDLNYLLNADKENPLFVSNVNSDFHLQRDNLSNEFSSLFGSLSITGGKVIIDKEIKDLNADLLFNGEKILMTANANYSDLVKAYLDGSIELTTEGTQFILDEVNLKYRDVSWKNKDEINFVIQPDSFVVRSLSLVSDKPEISLFGGMDNNGNLNFDANVKDLTGEDFTKLFFSKADQNFLANINLHSKITGSLRNPVIKSYLTADSLGYFDEYFGSLNGEATLQDNDLKLGVFFMNMSVIPDTLLTVTGNIPAEFSFVKNVNEELPTETNLKLKSSNFNLGALGDLIPSVKNLKGILNADISASGNIAKLKYDGSIRVANGYFLLAENNLGYNYSLTANFNDDLLEVKRLSIENAVNTVHKGKFNLTGSAKLKGFELDNAAISGEGVLAVLSPQTKDVNQNIYGDLVIRSNGKWDLVYKDGKASFNGDVDLTTVDVTLAPSNQVDVTPSGRIVYVIKSDTSNIDREENKFRRLLTEQIAETAGELDKSNFDYNFRINIVDEAKIQILLSKVWNQRLSILAKGNLEYENIDGNSRVQGAFDLQPGSKLEFVKSFDATGIIKFESDITNPYLDITADYRSTYNQGTDDSPDYIDVEVELKLNGTLDKLGANLMKNPDNIAIYKGAQNISTRTRESSYDISDAVLFIFYGRFKEDLTARDKSQIAGLGNTAASFLGTALSSIINSAVGDVVSNIQVDQQGIDTQIRISGRFQNVRYSIGGTTRIQNLSEANLKIEYQLLPNLLFRLERKDPVDRSYGVEEKISELGLKYKIEF